MVTCKVDSAVVPKMNRARKTSSSNSSSFRLLDGDQLDTVSSVSRNSIYKIKIDAMFDDTRSIRSNRFDDRRGSHRTRSIIMYGKSELTSTTTTTSKNGGTDSCHQSLLRNNNKCGSINRCEDTIAVAVATTVNDIERAHGQLTATVVREDVCKDGRRISNSVQAQIERMFTDVAKDATCSFAVRCLGSLPLKDKVTSLQGLQEPLRQLYLSEAAQGNQCNGHLDICGSGLRIRQGNDKDLHITPFHNIAVWSAVKFIVSQEEGGAAFLPLITDPENIDKSSLFRPLTAADQRRLSSGLHAPIFAVVMRSSGLPKLLECHGFVCQTPEDAIVIAATLYQSLMAHVSTNSHRSAKKRAPRNQNGVSCISIASSSALTGSNNYISRSNGSLNGVGRKNSMNGSNKGAATPSRPVRKKRIATSSLSGESDALREVQETTTEERKKKSHKTKRAPPIPTPARNVPNTKQTTRLINSMKLTTVTAAAADIIDFDSSGSYSSVPKPSSNGTGPISGKSHNLMGNNHNGRDSNHHPNGDSSYHTRGGDGGDILTRVAIPRSGSFLNTGGLTRYKSRATRRHSSKNGSGIGGGGGSPLGFSELFNEFRLHENLHSLDDILSAIIDADGMSFNDLKPIYKEFLLKLAVTLTKDELYQRSKNIMRRQKKKKLKRKNSSIPKKKGKTFMLGFGLKNVFRFGKFRSNKSIKNVPASVSKSKITSSSGKKCKDNPRNRVTTSGSDVSVAQNEHTMNALNRNSSSGYVSCSECSYDSEACTCASADRCYCSLGGDQQNRVNGKLKKRSTPNPRDSLVSCQTEDKCYCSMGDTPGDTTSDTTWCDTDSCNSVSKCYCQRKSIQHKKYDSNSQLNVKDITASLSEFVATKSRNNKSLSGARKGGGGGGGDKLGLDYELFTISNGGGDKRSQNRRSRSSNHHRNGGGNLGIENHPVRPHEALSVKKSVEAAAIFADVKLSQTTDIKSLRPTQAHLHDNYFVNKKFTTNSTIHSFINGSNGGGSSSGCGGGGGGGGSSSNGGKKRTSKRSESKSTDRQHKSTSRSSQQHHKKSSSADDILSKLNAMDKSKYRGSSKNSLKGGTVGESYYQSMRAVSASLEDSLGYLP